MIEAVVGAALWAIAATLVVGALLGGTVVVVIRASAPAATTRHALWTVAGIATGVAPLLIVGAMALRAGHAAPAAAVRWTPPATTTTTTERPRAGRIVVTTAPAEAAAPRRAPGFAVPPVPALAHTVALALVGVWLVGAAIGLAGLARSLARVSALKRRSSPLEGALADDLPWLTETAGREIYLRLSYETETPIAVGFRRPVILIPTELATADGLTAIEPLVMHEHAHLRRYDDWTNLVQRLIERLFWFNPLVWAIGRRIALEREVAADEAVVARTGEVKDYAATLWRLAREMRMPEHVAVAPGAFFTRKQISERIERLVEDRPHPRLGAAGVALGAFAATCVAAVAASAPALDLPAPAPTSAADLGLPFPVAPLAPQRAPQLPPKRAAQPEGRTARAAAPRPSPLTRIVTVYLTPPPGATPAPAHPHGHPRTIFFYSDQPNAPVPPHAAAPAGASETGAALGMEQMSREIAQAFGDGEPGRPLPAVGTIPRELLQHCSGCDLSNRDLRGVDLHGVSLVGANLSRANLAGANLNGAHLSGANFEGANLSHADLRRARMAGANLDRANLEGAQLDGMRLVGSSFHGASFRGAGPLRALVNDCSGCDFSGFDLRGADLHEITLSGANLSRADLRGANLRGARLTGITFEGANLEGADLSDASLHGCNLQGADLRGVALDRVALTGSSLP